MCSSQFCGVARNFWRSRSKPDRHSQQSPKNCLWGRRRLKIVCFCAPSALLSEFSFLCSKSKPICRRNRSPGAHRFQRNSGKSHLDYGPSIFATVSGIRNPIKLCSCPWSRKLRSSRLARISSRLPNESDQ